MKASQRRTRCAPSCRWEDTAEAALYLASPEARYVTGVNLNVKSGTK